MDVLKDRMYCDAANSLSRRSAQTAMYKILDCLVRMLAPILVHTAEEAWTEMNKSQQIESVHLALMPKVDDSIDWKAELPKWQRFMDLRMEVLQELEQLRESKTIRSNQEAMVRIETSDDEFLKTLQAFGEDNFAAFCIVSEVKIQRPTQTMGKGKIDITEEHFKVPSVHTTKSSYNKCQRCWNYWPSVGADSKHPDLCKRCVEVI